MSDNSPQNIISIEVLKTAYLEKGMCDWEISQQYYYPLEQVQELIVTYELDELRRKMLKNGMEKIKNQQLNHAEKLLEVENKFKTLKLVQLQNRLNDYILYYEKHGDFYRRNPVSGEVIYDMAGMPSQIDVPSVAKEIKELKDSFNFSEGLAKLVNRIDDLLNPGKTNFEGGEDEEEDAPIDIAALMETND